MSNNKNIYSNIELVIESTSNNVKGNSVNYKKLCNWNNSYEGNISTLGSNGDPSSYGLYDMGGQLYQWTDSPYQDNTKTKILRGGCFASDTPNAISKNHFKYLYIDDSIEDGFLGFRVASYINPANYSGYATVLNLNNPPDICDRKKLGSLNYEYRIMANLVSNSQYCEFLNSVDPYGIYQKDIYDPKMGASHIGGILFNSCADLSDGKYAVKPNMHNKPVAFITWVMASKYCNWLHNNKSNTWSSTLSGAYTTENTRSSTAKYFLPSESEWYKAAYYDPNKLGSGIPGYWTYSTKSDDSPLAIVSNNIGDAVGVENQFSDSKTFPIIIRASDEALQSSSASYATVSLSGYEQPYFSGYAGDSLTPIFASISGLNINQKYNYIFSSLSSNWPCRISPLSGEFVADDNNHSINAILQFKPQDVYAYTNFTSNLPYTDDPEIRNRNFANELYNNIALTISDNYELSISDNIKVVKKFISGSGTAGLPIVSQKDCAGIRFLTPSGSNSIEISGALCGQYVPLVMSVTNPSVGKAYNYLLSASEPAVILSPRSGTVAFGGGSGSLNRITSLLDLNGEDSSVIGVTLYRGDAVYSVSDYVSVKCNKPCEKSANNHANFDNKAIWGFCAPFCSGDPPVRRTDPSVTTVGTNGGPSAYGTYDQDGNILELCGWRIRSMIPGGSSDKEIYRGGSFNSTILGKYARFVYTVPGAQKQLNAGYDQLEIGRDPYNFDDDTMNNVFFGFRVASYTNPYAYSGFKLISDVGTPPTGNMSDSDAIVEDGATLRFGSVKYPYSIAEYPVTNTQYCEFLNSTSTTGLVQGIYDLDPESGMNPSWNYNYLMGSCYGGISRSGSGTNDSPYVYTVQPLMSDKPVRFINRFIAARYCNWLHNNKPTGLYSTQSGAYTFGYNSAGTGSNTHQYKTVSQRASCAKYFIPNEDEWYKAAYYNGNNTNNTSAEYWTYATQTNTLPGSVFASSVGNGLIPND